MFKPTLFCVLAFSLLLLVSQGQAQTPATETPRARQCFSNQKILQAGVEMYNMDHPEMIRNYSADAVTQLQKGGYVKEVPLCPEKGQYLSEGDMSKEGTIKCSAHGRYPNVPAPDVPAAPGDSAKSCMANQRVILGAVEMYNMDNTAMIKVLDSAALKGLVGTYLKKEPLCPEQGNYLSEGDLSRDGKIKCSKHGSVQ